MYEKNTHAIKVFHAGVKYALKRKIHYCAHIHLRFVFRSHFHCPHGIVQSRRQEDLRGVCLSRQHVC